ncbi:hypothetical protein HBH98_231740 [Parastagonospora nodorum]|nr:hypothetical protein HBH53_234650 [Parastagonospora nodorum]KAH3960000.1 hypothetical protein HBH52_240630 [Parastagonospora nodorum]KAH4012138.1 hypothetical protein HBI09_224540 [Parastagonospora nodorum]KAH4043193.1 hypothetical protein HBH49_237440 [Parastagonospora nodorum]KAH4056741.1 hypothetical protein HBH50_239710 [Parastagonospora nodorum]
MGSFLSGLFSVLILLVRFILSELKGELRPTAFYIPPHFHVPSTGNKLDQSTWHTRIQDWLPRS